MPALEQIHLPVSVLRTAALLRDEGEVLDALVGSSTGAPGGSDLAPSGSRLPPRCGGSSCNDSPMARPGASPAPRKRGRGRAAPHQLRVLDLGGGVRAVASAGVLHAERS